MIYKLAIAGDDSIRPVKGAMPQQRGDASPLDGTKKYSWIIHRNLWAIVSQKWVDKLYEKYIIKEI